MTEEDQHGYDADLSAAMAHWGRGATQWHGILGSTVKAPWWGHRRRSTEGTAC